ncbi:MAG: FAD-dependent oxidoreductase [Armatimonadetes bacterium]|nr:FAD-dependent oxidoreductase [Armatimonadota bacterium]
MPGPGNSSSAARDVVVVGEGISGAAAAIAAAANGARTLLVASEGAVGGDAITGLPILGACNSRGEWIVGGVLRALLDECRDMGGFIGPVCDWRTVWGVCVDPECFRLALTDMLAATGVELLLHTIADDVQVRAGRVEAVSVVNRNGHGLIPAKLVIDATGDAGIARQAGAPVEVGGEGGELQPISLTFRMCNVDFAKLLAFVRDNPSEFLLAENPVFPDDPAECARRLADAGYPYAALSAGGGTLGGAIESETMFPCTAVFMTPTSVPKRELCLNTTRLADLDATDISELSKALGVLNGQIETAAEFLRTSVPGFEQARISGIAHRIGIRETGRIVGEYVLTADDVIEGRSSPRGVARGAHHVDIHGSGTDQVRIPVRGGGSYDIPYECLIPRNVTNLLAVGRCISSTREANGSARVMGTCMATGEAGGTAAALCAERGIADVRALSVRTLRERLLSRGAILE